MNELNKKQRTFAEAYAIPGTECYGNATKSAIKAGYAKGSAEVTGSKLLRMLRFLITSRGLSNNSLMRI